MACNPIGFCLCTLVAIPIYIVYIFNKTVVLSHCNNYISNVQCWVREFLSGVCFNDNEYIGTKHEMFTRFADNVMIQFLPPNKQQANLFFQWNPSQYFIFYFISCFCSVVSLCSYNMKSNKFYLLFHKPPHHLLVVLWSFIAVKLEKVLFIFRLVAFKTIFFFLTPRYSCTLVNESGR